MLRHRNPAYLNPAMDFLNPVVDALMCSQKDTLDATLQSLLDRNAANGFSEYCYMHGGKFFSLYSMKALKGFEIGPIHPSLTDEAESLFLAREQLERDTKQIRQGLSTIANKCRSKQDIRDVLPEILAQIVPDFQSMPRLREEGFLLQDNPLLQAQYERTMDLAYKHQVDRLFS